MPGERRHFEIVHAGAPEIAVGEIEAGRLDDVDGDPHAGGEAQDRAGVAGDVWLVERDAQILLGVHVFFLRGRFATGMQRPSAAARLRVVIDCECVYEAAIVNANRRRRIWNS